MAAVQNSAWCTPAPNSANLDYLFGRTGNATAGMAATLDKVCCVYDSLPEAPDGCAVHPGLISNFTLRLL
jgi:hypothetical protein